ncbi:MULTISPECIES: hypothetical protein [Xenorhabdus]|uniref:hypothetical protein n=1 Tax=Xenorhabdus TaxID=626 RepID=UPI001FC9E9DE|nr:MULTISPECIES: hypothetical protein [Xenorhabdus]
MHTTAQIVTHVWARWQVTFTVAGMTIHMASKNVSTMCDDNANIGICTITEPLAF